MNVFSKRRLGLQQDALLDMRVLTQVAAIVIVHERSRQHDETLIEQLETALSSRVVIDQAKGVLAERLGIPLDEAFGLLRGYARNHSLRIAVVASDVVTGRRTLDR